jgi:nitrous oxide reductase accessory protein NosL
MGHGLLFHFSDTSNEGLVCGGSDVFGPMGNELVPFNKESDAREFMKDHTGKKILRFSDITLDMVKALD